LRINPEALRAIIEHGELTYPYECCGFLFGSDNQSRSIEEAVPVDNSQPGDQRKRFEISPLDYMKAEKYGLENNLDLIGVYHSHPEHPAIPSRHDHKQALPFFSYIILSVREGEFVKVASWKLDDQGNFENEEIEALNKFELKS